MVGCLLLSLTVAAPEGDASVSCESALISSAQEMSVALDRIFPLPHHAVSSTAVHVGGCVHLPPGGWWRYEFCPGRWIRQYHEANSVVLSEYFLGIRTQSALHDDKVGNQKLKYTDGDVRTRDKVRMHLASLPQSSDSTSPLPESTCDDAWRPPRVSIPYEKGSVCDLNGKPRSATVVYACESLDESIAWNVTEIRECDYVVVVTGQFACAVLGVPSHDISVDTRPQRKSSTTAASKAQKIAPNPPSSAPAPAASSQQPPAVDTNPRGSGSDAVASAAELAKELQFAVLIEEAGITNDEVLCEGDGCSPTEPLAEAAKDAEEDDDPELIFAV